MQSTTDTYTGKSFRYNETVVVGGITTVARITSRTNVYLHPDRLTARMFAQLNLHPERKP